MRSASRLLQVLSAFTLDAPAKTIAEISRELELSASTVRRLMLTLEEHGFVRVDAESGRYRLHHEVVRLGAVAAQTSSLIDVAGPVMERLRDKTEETTQLAVRSGVDVVFVGTRDGPLGLRIFHPVGWRHPTYLGSAPGKVLLASLPDDELTELLPEGPWPGHTSRTVVSPEAFIDSLGPVRERGYAINDGETEQGVWAVAAPIRDHTGAVVAALNLPCPAARVPASRRMELITVTVEAADEISAALRFRPES
ncbi:MULTISPECIES: IclR family transcriptional regulator [Prauserella]|nr:MULTISPECIES: IclR family transcriptional regulator [Prauserella]